MKVVVKEPNQPAKVREIGKELEDLKDIVGGYIEVLHIGEGIIMVCNEEGKFEGLAPNLDLDSDVVVGTVFFVSSEGEEFESLTNSQVEQAIRFANDHSY